VLESETEAFNRFVDEHNVETLPGTRSIVIVDIHQVGSSCGYSVPFFDFREFRPVLNNHWKQKMKRVEQGKSDETMDK
jgi:hypothetical protein